MKNFMRDFAKKQRRTQIAPVFVTEDLRPRDWICGVLFVASFALIGGALDAMDARIDTLEREKAEANAIKARQAAKLSLPSIRVHPDGGFECAVPSADPKWNTHIAQSCESFARLVKTSQNRGS